MVNTYNKSRLLYEEAQGIFLVVLTAPLEPLKL